MVKRAKLIDCIFCGDQQVPRGTEDVIPKWLRKKLAYFAEQHHPGTKPNYVDYSYKHLADWVSDRDTGTPDRAKQRKTGEVPAPFHLPEVCRECNHGWMGHLEMHAGILLPKLLLGEPRPLAPYDQFVLATWAVKTFLTFDAAHEEPWIPTRFGTRPFYESGFPSIGTHVLIGTDPDHVVEGAIAHGRHLRFRGPAGRITDGSIAFWFQFDRCCFYGLFNFSERLFTEGALMSDQLPPDWPLFSRLEVKPPYFHELWPPVERFRWPSDEALIPRSRSAG